MSSDDRPGPEGSAAMTHQPTLCESLTTYRDPCTGTTGAGHLAEVVAQGRRRRFRTPYTVRAQGTRVSWRV